jgi:hypothetical protein
LKFMVTRTIPEGDGRVEVRFWHGFCAGFSKDKAGARLFPTHGAAGTEAENIQAGRGLSGLVVVPAGRA